ncbi:serine--tRNA ligase [Candidatus Nomurabacteria bacterium]|nr:serine--tRNA ligase [Candidatus Nomurabacteria bacterium]USN95048.1 MAG: serine--tRNA ligase [Candidatus Nomurabacteria bacterium]
MLDIKFIRENKDVVKEAISKKKFKVDLDELLALDDKRLDLLSQVEPLRAEQNKASESISSESDPEKRNKLIEEMKEVKTRLSSLEEELKDVMVSWQKLMLEVPNVPDVSVPDGNTDEDNQEVKQVGEKPTFSFTPKDHIELMESLDLADFERGTKVSGFRGYFLKNEGATLSFAIWQYMMEKMVSKGFIPMIVPSLVNKETLYGTGYLPNGEEDLYKTQDEEYLAGTGEVATMAYYRNEILDKAELPKKMIAFSPCFRREAGSHGKDVKGLIRVHEFFKLEQVVLCEASHEESVKFHEELTKNAEEMLQDFGLHYRVVINCGGDLGLGQVKKYDIEVWVPSQNKYRETHSSSYFHDFQSRRLNIRYKDDEGKNRYVHSLNNTAVATPRILTAIIENYQTEDGKIRVPEVLKKYIGKDFIER